MRIALLHYAVPPIIGGVEAIVAAHQRLFTEAGHEVVTIARRGDAGCMLKSPDPLAELRHALSGCDIVIVHNVLTMPFDLPLTEALWQLAEEQSQARWIAWVHDIAVANQEYDQPWHKPPWDRLARASTAFTYVAVSEHRARQFSALTGVLPRVIPNGVHPAEVLGLTPNVSALCGRAQLLSREIVLIHPTRLLRRKNVEFGLEVIGDLRARGRDAVSLVTAAADAHNTKSAEYARELRIRRKQLGLCDCVSFIADEFPVDQSDLVSLYSVADALFFPSRQEGFGLPVVEAALHRLPIFGADVQPVNSLLEHGMYVFDPDGSPSEVARLIERTLDRAPAFRSRREALRRYAWTAVWQEHLAPLLGGK